MTIKRCNWRSDLQLSETFYELSATNTLVKTTIPDDSIDFQLVYRAEHDRRYSVGREGGVYRGCKKIDDYTLAVFLPISRHPLGRGPLLRELYMQVPNNDFEDKKRHICVPADTKHFLWDGPTDNAVVVSTEIVTATILKGNTGDSAYQDAVQYGYQGTEQEYAAWPITQGNAARDAAVAANNSAVRANGAADRVDTSIENAEVATQNAQEITQTMRDMKPQIEEAASLIPGLLRMKYPAHITTANTRRQVVEAKLLPSWSLQNIIFQVEEGTSVFVRPDGEIIRRGVGTTRINVLPTANIPLFQTIDITVEQPRIRLTGAGKIRRTAAGNIRLT